MTMTTEQARDSSIAFVDRAVNYSVHMVLSTNGMNGENQSRHITPLDERGSRLRIVVNYGDDLQSRVEGEAHVTGSDRAWTNVTLSLTGDAAWDITAQSFPNHGVRFSVKEK